MNLYEKTLTLSDKQKHKYSQQIWNLLCSTYDAHGGLCGADLTNLLKTAGMWEVEIMDGNVIAGAIFRNLNGKKLRLIFHNGTLEGKQAIKKILYKTMVVGPCWGEISGALEKTLKSIGVKMIPNEYAEILLEREISRLDPDGFHYYRTANNELRKKVLMGNPHL